ncbi:hypothetical protein [Leucobacter sp. M11]|uniref:hypothetical protein n=1 Tax=Leucobacter sp. M11 TaxID=2993565 RepID=UPI002D80C6EA|nr:hypothetical protein [Leucobacter sp. M11]MEB4613643.1 hypothetical protein [Leucobacter sp. M11]
MSTKNQQPSSNTPNVWSSRLELNSLGTDLPNSHAPGAEEPRRARSSKIEKEIISAVVVLYAGIIACFAGLHIYGLTLG